MEDLDNLRLQIDGIDRQILSLLNQRYEVVKKVGEWKHAHNQPIYVPEREKLLLPKYTLPFTVERWLGKL